MDIVITDLEEFSKKRAVYAKLGDYKIDVNDIPLKLALKVNNYFKGLKNGEDIDPEILIDEIVIPLIQKQNANVDKEKISEDFNYDQLLKLMNMVFESYLHAGADSKETKEADTKNKKKEN
ncbi:hypothetical protein [Brachyspira hampsonii]|uniref:Uncharacterized protein n=1 Tax=Brachyspira hampsonii TaxID=1287055 RepID=A0A1E5NMD2_9SPIR|nr:hypothetical protein [Brachyspira hampsonii]ASJ21579.1 hypothetical protein BHAMNSH16_07950 [Brachyspira hampsonii]ASJ22483.1 hypothetical protein BHAMNSH16_12860 [Brachyspira hampsonii]ELV06203.1 hypothetical protein H263_05652 [Brachyspira hampsonii 30599]MBW5379864.1 hypothetical protein [Brachyspira hampsonii]MBW5409752.1 hypothetical protein [Brachyspira hampsonii]